MARGVSTVLDVAVCLLLVGAALATLAAAPPASTDHRPTADATAQTVATATTSIPHRQNTRHATLAAHLGSAAVSAATVGTRPLLSTSYPDAVRQTTGDEIPHTAFVTARWRPVPNASVGGRIQAGRDPPPNADVSAATLSVETGIDPLHVEADPSFGSVATAIADPLVEWLFPPRRTRAALQDPRTEPAVTDRYRSVAATLDVDVEQAVEDRNVARANDVLTRALATQIERELRETYDRPRVAVDAVTLDTATVVVRRWDHRG